MQHKKETRAVRVGRLTKPHSRTLIKLQEAYLDLLPFARSKARRRDLTLMEAELRRAVIEEMVERRYAWYAIGLQLGIQGHKAQRLHIGREPVVDGPYREAVKSGKATVRFLLDREGGGGGTPPAD